MKTPLALEAFVSVVEAGSISAAARLLNDSRSMLSRRLSKLEDQLGVPLLRRSSRRLVLTRAGEELYRRGKLIVADVRAAEQAVRRLDDEPRGPLRVTLPNGPASGILAELFSDFLQRFPQVSLELFSTDRHVDLVQEGFDVALRAGATGDGHLMRRVLSRSQLFVVGSPAYLEQFGTPTTLKDLSEHSCIVGYGGGIRTNPAWPLLNGGTTRVRPGLIANDLTLALGLTLRAQGLAVLPDILTGDALAQGSLVPVLRDLIGAHSPLSLVFHENKLMEPQVRAFVDFAADWFELNGQALIKVARPQC